MVVAGTAHVGVVEQRRLAAVLGRRFVALLGKEGGDAFTIERAEFEGEFGTSPLRAEWSFTGAGLQRARIGI